MSALQDVTKLNPMHLSITGEAEKEEDSRPNEKFDFCLVFSVDPSTGKFTVLGKEVADRIIQFLGRHNVALYYSVDKDKIIMLTRAKLDSIKNFAARKDVKLLLAEHELKKQAEIGWPEYNVKPLGLETDNDITSLTPYEKIYGTYKTDEEFQHLYEKPLHLDHPFSDHIRLDLTRRLLEEPVESGGLNIKFGELMTGEQPCLLAFFPLHNRKKRERLEKEWLEGESYLPWNQPFNLIKNYFGTKIGLYFRFLGHFSLWLTIPSIIGMGAQLAVAGQTKIDSPVIPFFSLILVLWGTMMLEFWKRKEINTALAWGTVGFENVEGYRAAFKYDKAINLAGEEILYFDISKKRKLLIESFTVIMMFCALVIGTTATIYIARFYIDKGPARPATPILASFMNGFQIMFFTYVYELISVALNDRENHKTDTQYEDSMIIKSFVFQFINSYASFFFIGTDAYFKRTHTGSHTYFTFLAFFAASAAKATDDDTNVGQCGYPSCMMALAINLGVVQGMRLIQSNIKNVMLPYLKYRMKEKENIEKGRHEMMSFPEAQFQLEAYDNIALISDYLEVSIQFGFMTMFASALPGATFMTLIFNAIEIRGDAWTLLNFNQRPFPRGAEDIGSWQHIFEAVLVSAVVTNAALIVFTMDLLNHYSTYRKFWIFIGFQWVMFTGQYVLATLVDDVPQQVEIQLQRADFINRKIIMREADETDRVSRHSIHIGWNVDEHISSDINEAIKELESQSTGQSTI